MRIVDNLFKYNKWPKKITFRLQNSNVSNLSILKTVTWLGSNFL